MFCAMPRPIPPHLAQQAAERFWKFVDTSGGYGHDKCWLWTGRKDGHGYGVLSLGRTTSRSAHRMSWVICHGTDPGELWVLHHCDTPACVKPSHLYLGDRAKNVQDMYERNRRPSVVIAEQFRGEKHYRTSLTEDDVRELRSLHPALSYSQLAAKYGLTKSGVVQIIKRRTWRHV